MSAYYSDDLVTLHHGDCVEVMRSLPEASVDAVVTDPPYGLEFMGKDWDAPWKGQGFSGNVEKSATSAGGALAYSSARVRYQRGLEPMMSFQAWFTEVAAQALRVLKPGGHLLAFGGTRTWHRLAVAIEDAGFEVRDNIAYLHDGGLPGPLAWVYGSGFPKSLDVSKAIDKRAGAEREVIGTRTDVATRIYDNGEGDRLPQEIAVTAPATPAAQQWQGWGTALKPAFEPIVVARKPLDGTVAENVLRHRTGALNIDGSRIGTEQRTTAWAGTVNYKTAIVRDGSTTATGRWPANVILDESQAAELDRQSGVLHSQDPATRYRSSDPSWSPSGTKRGTHGVRTQQTGADTGGASRFFYVPKANASERPRDGDTAHPTVKPLDLMRYLVKLVTPPGGTVLEPFAGSGTTLEACVIEGFYVIGIELTEDYLPLIVQRLSKPIEQVLW